MRRELSVLVDNPFVFERFTEEAIQAVRSASNEAQTLGHQSIGTGHLLLGVLLSPGPPATWQQLLPKDLDRVRHELVALVGPGVAPTHGVEWRAPLDAEAKAALDDAVGEALRAGRRVVEPADLITALARATETVCAITLRRLGTSHEALTREISRNRSPPASLGPSKQPPPRSRQVEPPAGVAPAVVGLDLILGQSDRVAVILPCARVYPDGMEIEILVLSRAAELHGSPFRGSPTPPGRERQASVDIEIGYADGRRAPLAAMFSPGARLQVIPRGGHGSNTYVDTSFYLPALPPPGDLTITCQ
jgi:hypothetical protein